MHEELKKLSPNQLKAKRKKYKTVVLIDSVSYQIGSDQGKPDEAISVQLLDGRGHEFDEYFDSRQEVEEFSKKYRPFFKKEFEKEGLDIEFSKFIVPARYFVK